MKRLLTLVFLVVFGVASTLRSQNVIAVTTPAGQTTVYTLLETALNNAGNGDYVYLPGGTFAFTKPLRKSVTIIGAGHYPDSTVYTNRTIIEGSVSIGAGASNAMLEGMYFTGDINFVPNEKTENVVIRRCNVGNVIVGNNWNRNDTARCYNPLILHNVIRGVVETSESYGFTVMGNIINGAGQVCIYHGGTYENNIFLSVGDRVTMGELRNVTFKNNIFMNTQALGYQGYACYGYDGGCGSWGCSFINNLFIGKDTTLNVIPLSSLRVGNIFLANPNDLFVRQSGLAFDYNQDYRIKSNSPYKGTGDDGTDVGIYGTSNPYKASALPSNPHISFKDIPASTLPNGTIPLKIKVSAQEK